jgi:hypothetical protein
VVHRARIRQSIYLEGSKIHAKSFRLEEPRIDVKSLNFSVNTDLSRDGQGRKTLQRKPGPQVDERAWLNSIRDMSSTDLAKRLGITDRQARRIKTGKVGSARLREHAKRDHDQQKEARRPRLRRVWAAFILRRAADPDDAVIRIAA